MINNNILFDWVVEQFQMAVNEMRADNAILVLGEAIAMDAAEALNLFCVWAMDSEEGEKQLAAYFMGVE